MSLVNVICENEEHESDRNSTEEKKISRCSIKNKARRVNKAIRRTMMKALVETNQNDQDRKSISTSPETSSLSSSGCAAQCQASQCRPMTQKTHFLSECDNVVSNLIDSIEASFAVIEADLLSLTTEARAVSPTEWPLH